MRKAVKADKESILNIWAQCFAADSKYQGILSAMDYPLVDTYVHEANGQVVSILTLLPIEWKGNGEVRKGHYVYGVGTLPQYRGKGYSTLLMKQVLAEIKEQGSDFAVLYPADESLQEFYKNQGFVSCGKQLEIAVDEEVQENWLDNADDFSDADWELQPIESGREYQELRDNFLAKSCKSNDGYFSWTADHYAFNHNEAAYSNGGLCKITQNDEAKALAACWVQDGNGWEQGKIIVKEMLFAEDEAKDAALSMLAEFAGGKSLVLCQPAWEKENSLGEIEEVNFGMINWLNQDRKVDFSESYLALVLD